MKKVFNWIKRNRSKIFIIWAICMIVINVLPTNDIIQNNAVFAEITHDPNDWITEGDRNEGKLDALISILLNTSTGVLGTPVATLINCFTLIIFLVLLTVFQFLGVSSGGGALSVPFPFPDQIIFNKLAFFDPNFINPATDDAGDIISSSPVGAMQSIIQNMYYSFFILAGTIFVIAAMVIGIKLAVSTLASQKAQYKAALTNWVMGVVLLFTVHFLMAGMFYINEQIVETAYNVSKSSAITFQLDISEISIIGRTLGSIVEFVGETLTGDPHFGEWDVEGYSGYLIVLVVNAVTGDLVSSIVLAIILGQTVSLVITYTKRLFYCIILGMMAPIIVAVDVIRKSMT